jgi:hypothetical protein
MGDSINTVKIRTITRCSAVSTAETTPGYRAKSEYRSKEKKQKKSVKKCGKVPIFGERE